MSIIRKWLGLHVHEWTKWADEYGVYAGEGKRHVGNAQTRECTVCGKKQMATVWL